jgi:prepilin-type N-terminal cleavage/methylation domain-containing protein
MGKKGFSLIELLVVVAIMAILIGLSAFGLQQARESARDGQRKSDLETIRTGLSFYRSDCNAYPIHTGSDFYTLFHPSFSSTCTGTTNTYIQKTPKDTLSGNNYYYISTVGTTYTICASLETEGSTVATGCSTANCGGTCNYSVFNP